MLTAVDAGVGRTVPSMSVVHMVIMKEMIPAVVEVDCLRKSWVLIIYYSTYLKKVNVYLKFGRSRLELS